MISLLFRIQKIQQTSEYNSKNNKNRLTDIKNKLVVTSGERGRGNIRVWDEEVQTIMYKISYKDILYNTENIANIL